MANFARSDGEPQLAPSQATSDRFYRALYTALLHPALPTSTKASMLLALVFKAVRDDTSDKRAAAFVKRLLQVAAHAPSGFSCGALLLVSELLKVTTRCCCFSSSKKLFSG